MEAGPSSRISMILICLGYYKLIQNIFRCLEAVQTPRFTHACTCSIFQAIYFLTEGVWKQHFWHTYKTKILVKASLCMPFICAMHLCYCKDSWLCSNSHLSSGTDTISSSTPLAFLLVHQHQEQSIKGTGLAQWSFLIQLPFNINAQAEKRYMGVSFCHLSPRLQEVYSQ